MEEETDEINIPNGGHLVHDEETAGELSQVNKSILRHRRTSNLESGAVQFKDITVEVGSKKKRKKILQDVDGTVTSGRECISEQIWMCIFISLFYVVF
jgi:hypothetical protein